MSTCTSSLHGIATHGIGMTCDRVQKSRIRLTAPGSCRRLARELENVRSCTLHDAAEQCVAAHYIKCNHIQLHYITLLGAPGCPAATRRGTWQLEGAEPHARIHGTLGTSPKEKQNLKKQNRIHKHVSEECTTYTPTEDAILTASWI